MDAEFYITVTIPNDEVCFKMDRRGVSYYSHGGRQEWYVDIDRAERLFDSCLRSVRAIQEVEFPTRSAGRTTACDLRKDGGSAGESIPRHRNVSTPPSADVLPPSAPIGARKSCDDCPCGPNAAVCQCVKGHPV